MLQETINFEENIFLDIQKNFRIADKFLSFFYFEKKIE